MNDQIQSISPNIPQPKKGMPKWAPAYLEALEQTQGVLTAAAKLVNLTYSAVYKARRAYPDFDKVVTEIKAEWDSRHLEDLEELSVMQAKKPGCTTERIFQLNALNPSKYRPRQQGPQVGPLTIVLGFTPPKHRGGMDESKEITADAAVQKIPSSTDRGRHSGADILSEDDVDLDI